MPFHACFWAIPRNKISKHAQESIFLIKILKILRVFAQDVAYGMKAYVLWKCRLVNVGNLNLTCCQCKL